MNELAASSGAAGAVSIIKKPLTAAGSAKLPKPAVSFGQCHVFEYQKESHPFEKAKKVDSKDISDMRDEKTRIRAMLQAQERDEIENAKKMREMMKSTTEQPQQAEEEPASSTKEPSSMKIETIEFNPKSDVAADQEEIAEDLDFGRDDEASSDLEADDGAEPF